MANIEKYLPSRFQDIEEFMSLCLAEDPEFDNMAKIRVKWLNNKFPREADLDGIKIFEKILELKPLDTDTIEDRRERIIAKLNARLPYTWIQLHRMMAAICGWEGYTLHLEDFVLLVYLSLENNDKIRFVIDLLYEVLPMHIMIRIERAIDEYNKIAIRSYSKNLGTAKILPYQKRNLNVNVVSNTATATQALHLMEIRPFNELPQVRRYHSKIATTANKIISIKIKAKI